LARTHHRGDRRGTYTTRALAVGAKYLVKAKVKVKSTATKGRRHPTGDHYLRRDGTEQMISTSWPLPRYWRRTSLSFAAVRLAGLGLGAERDGTRGASP